MLIYEIPGTDNVMIDDIIMEGFIDDNKCTKCDNPDCTFCRNRPNLPLKSNS